MFFVELSFIVYLFSDFGFFCVRVFRINGGYCIIEWFNCCCGFCKVMVVFNYDILSIMDYYKVCFVNFDFIISYCDYWCGRGCKF